MVALSALLTAVFDIAHFVGVATVEHLGHQRVIVGRLITGTNVFKRNRLGCVVKTGIMPQFATSDHWQAAEKEPLHPVERPHARQ
jgi:hypothetical protein